MVNKNVAPSYTFGVKHSVYSGLVRVEEYYQKHQNVFQFLSMSQITAFTGKLPALS